MTDSDTNKPQPLRLRMLPNDSGMMTELREELRRRGAPTSGRYEELVARLDALVGPRLRRTPSTMASAD